MTKPTRLAQILLTLLFATLFAIGLHASFTKYAVDLPSVLLTDLAGGVCYLLLWLFATGRMFKRDAS